MSSLDEKLKKHKQRLDKRIKKAHKSYKQTLNPKKSPRDMLFAKNGLNGNLIFLKEPYLMGAHTTEDNASL